MNRTVQVLNELRKNTGVSQCLVVGRDGFVIDHVGELEADAVGAIISTAIGAVESLGRDSDQGSLFEFMAEFEGGVTLVAPIGRDAVLGVVASTETNLGRVRYGVKKHLAALAETL